MNLAPFCTFLQQMLGHRFSYRRVVLSREGAFQEGFRELQASINQAARERVQ